MFLAECERFSARGIDVDPNKVPDYYRRYIGGIEGLFCLKSISQAEYDETLAKRLGERTLIHVKEQGPESAEHVSSTAKALDRSSVLHLSDLHFGADYGFLPQGERPEIGDGRRTLTECVVADLERVGLRNDVAAVIVTGDFITKGDWNDRVRGVALKEFEALRETLQLEKTQLIAVPGNHDIVRYPDGANINIAEIAVTNQYRQQNETSFRTFAEDLVGRRWNESLNHIRTISLAAVDLQICVLNSCTISGTLWREYGYVGAGGIDAIHDLGHMVLQRPTFRFVALHHHLLPVAEVEAPASQGVTLALDASAILSEAQTAGVHVVLHGHQHKAKLATYLALPLLGEKQGKPIHVVSNGSTSAARLPTGETNSYCVFTVEVNQLRLRMRELRTNAKLGAELFNDLLDASPAVA
jgi:3',5'-cyclic AMP phosphodiesterase CpdA